jgi:hypothetical protein
MKKIVKLTESDLARIVKRTIKEQGEGMGHDWSIYDDIESELDEMENDEAIDYLKGIISHCEKLIEKLDGNTEDEETITIPSKYDGIIMELGEEVSPEDIIEMYNELVASEGESVLLMKYEDGSFWNEFMDDVTIDAILDELNYAIVGEDDDDYDDEDEDY